MIKASIIQNRQLDLRYNTVFLNYDNIYGIKDSCSTVNNITLCAPNHLKRLNNEDCLFRILRSSSANCTFLSNTETIIEQMEDDLVFITNFKGIISSPKNSMNLNGTYLIRYFNETIKIGEKKFTNERITNMQALPPLLANVYEKERKLDVNLLQELHEKNIKQIKHLQYHLNFSFGSHIMGYLLIFIIAVTITILWRKIFGQIKVPPLNLHTDTSKESSGR